MGSPEKASLFEATEINGMRVPNRFVRSATFASLADEDGAVTHALTDLHVALADGGTGLIVTGYAYVLKNGQAAPRQLGAHDDAKLSGLESLAQAVHRKGGVIACQIVHCGAHSNAAATGEEPMGPSVLTTDDGPICREMTKEDIAEVVVAFGDAAARVKQAGFDAVQIHAAHGYLLSQFISPFYNRRSDEYGGSVENRARIVVETYRRVREVVGKEYPVLIKLNCTDLFDDDGLQPEDALLIAKMLEREGIDAIELSGGTAWASRVLKDAERSPLRTVETEAYYRDIATQMVAQGKTPIILTGGIRSFETAAEIVDSRIADYIGLCRPLIREPGLVNRWKGGDTSPSGCTSDNGCFKPMSKGLGPRCVRIKTGRD